ncbi:MAG TPA: aldehyde dehydrogenase family protein [Streptosporangiaceae bacterium]
MSASLTFGSKQSAGQGGTALGSTARVAGVPVSLDHYIGGQRVPSASGDPDRAARVSAALVAGTVWVNCFFVRDLRAPFGGSRNSGIGREGGDWSFDFYCDVKNTVTAPGGWTAAPRPRAGQD